MRILFMGTPDFAVESLKKIYNAGYDIVGVITATDKPAGRGHKLRPSPVKTCALELGLKVLQPKNLKAPEFIEELKSLNADLQVVVAFRMLPAVVFAMPKLGCFNLHASLLPQYRGAAPINWAVINGEKETGITTFFIEQQIDTGKMLLQKTVSITEIETAGTLHDKLMLEGAELVLDTVKLIEGGNYSLTDQKVNEDIKKAPKIHSETCLIDWTKKGEELRNFIRGLSPYPGAYSFLNSKKVIIYKSTFVKEEHNHSVGSIITDNKKQLDIAVTDGYIKIQELKLSGKKKMNTNSFLSGYREELQLLSDA